MNLRDTCGESCTVTGTGDITLTGALPSMRTFAAAYGSIIGASFAPIMIEELDAQGEVIAREGCLLNVAAVMGGGLSLQRGAISSSSADGARVDFGSGLKRVFVYAPVEAFDELTTAVNTKLAASALSAYGLALAAELDATAARGRLGLGNSATRNIGTTAGTVAAGDDARFGAGGMAINAAITGATATGGEPNPILYVDGDGKLQQATKHALYIYSGYEHRDGSGVPARFQSASMPNGVDPGVLLVAGGADAGQFGRYYAVLPGRLKVGDAISFASKTVSELAAITPTAGYFFWCTNETGGACLVNGNGSVWKRTRDLVTVS